MWGSVPSSFCPRGISLPWMLLSDFWPFHPFLPSTFCLLLEMTVSVWREGKGREMWSPEFLLLKILKELQSRCVMLDFTWDIPLLTGLLVSQSGFVVRILASVFRIKILKMWHLSSLPVYILVFVIVSVLLIVVGKFYLLSHVLEVKWLYDTHTHTPVLFLICFGNMHKGNGNTY